MILINKKTLTVISTDDFRAANHESVFPSVLTNAAIIDTDYLIVEIEPRPEVQPWQHTSFSDIYIAKGRARRDWVIIDQDINELKAVKRAEINRARDEAEVAGIDYAGTRFDTDEKSQLKILAVVSTNSLPPNGYWTDANNIDVAVDTAYMQGMYGAMMDMISNIHDSQRNHKKTVDALTTHAEVFNYEYSI